MNLSAILDRLDYERRHVPLANKTYSQTGLTTRMHSVHSRRYYVIHSTLTAECADAAIEAEIEHHRRLGVSFEWKLYMHDTPIDLLERLRQRGFTIGEREAVLVYDVDRGAEGQGSAIANTLGARKASLAQLSKEPFATVRWVRSASEFADFERLAHALYEDHAEHAVKELKAALDAKSQHYRCYVAYSAEGEPVSLARLEANPESQFGSLYGGATLPEHRHQGHYRALVSARAADAATLGAKYLNVDALPTSRPILERLGFVHLSETYPCVWTP